MNFDEWQQFIFNRTALGAYHIQKLISFSGFATKKFCGHFEFLRQIFCFIKDEQINKKKNPGFKPEVGKISLNK
jgi:hypothetical protein